MSKLKAVAWKVLTLLHLNTSTRIVIALSPVFAGAAGLIVAYSAKLGLPVHLNPAELVGLFATGATLYSAKLLVWLHGAQRAKISDTQIAARDRQSAAIREDAAATATRQFGPLIARPVPAQAGTMDCGDDCSCKAPPDLRGALTADDIPAPAHLAENVQEIGAPE